MRSWPAVPSKRFTGGMQNSIPLIYLSGNFLKVWALFGKHISEAMFISGRIKNVDLPVRLHLLIFDSGKRHFFFLIWTSLKIAIFRDVHQLTLKILCAKVFHIVVAFRCMQIRRAP